MSDDNLDNLHKKLNDSLELVRTYDWLLNSFFLDFYVEKHWEQLPQSWKKLLITLEPPDLSFLLNNYDKPKIIWPLSLLCLKALLHKLCISRELNKDFVNNNNNHFSDNKLKIINNLSPYITDCRFKYNFLKHIKPKKLHEIIKMSEICAKTASETNVKHIVDFGSGLGHLSRYLAYGYYLNVCCIEQQEKLTARAGLFDQQLEDKTFKLLPEKLVENLKRPLHLNIQLTKDTKAEMFLNNIKKLFNINKNDEFKFGIVGLHPCGDLAIILMKIFNELPEAKFINIVGCCYMKLTCDNTCDNFINNNYKFIGYPLSNYLREKINKNTNLYYESRELACHANEIFYDNLLSNNYHDLRVHAYRATIEQIIIKNWPKLKHCGLKNVKTINNLTFREYCKKAVTDLNIEIPLNEINCLDVQMNLLQWKRIVMFYTLRLMVAPIIESIILYDRLVYLKENDHLASIEVIFDPKLSPRNNILIGIKKR